MILAVYCSCLWNKLPLSHANAAPKREMLIYTCTPTPTPTPTQTHTLARYTGACVYSPPPPPNEPPFLPRTQCGKPPPPPTIYGEPLYPYANPHLNLRIGAFWYLARSSGQLPLFLSVSCVCLYKQFGPTTSLSLCLLCMSI